ncbi:unnamed protein product [Colias eurytheme]|nr:unnamed protein product [Colias eurytheme]
MASRSRRVEPRSGIACSDDTVLALLEESDVDFSSDDDTQDPTYNEPTEMATQERRRYDSSDSSVNSDSHDVVEPPSPALSSGSIIRQATGSGLRRARSSRRPRRSAQPTYRQIPSQSQPDVVDLWTGNFEPLEINLYEPTYVPNFDHGWSYEQFFERYIDEQILIKIVDCTNRTAVHVKGRSLGLTIKELKVYIGVTMIMASLQYPQIDMYWSSKWKQPIITSAMTRLRFYAIRTSLKVVYDLDVTAEERQKDKIWKVRPLFEKVRQGCLVQPRTAKMSIDEMIIPFTGQCCIRQYNPNKPNPLGLKVFVLATPQGMVIDFEIYQGDTTFPEIRQMGFGLGEAAILRLTEALVPGHHIFFDRYFTTIKLCDELLNKGFHATGTIMRNRLPKNCMMEEDKIFMKKQRGYCEIKTRADGKMAVTRWMDNKPVVMLSTRLSNTHADECERWSKKNKVYERVRRPEVIKEYNENMGGVDLVDRMLAVCPSRNRTKKWTIRVISHMIDLAVANSYLQFKQREKKKGVKNVIGIREFKMELGEKLIADNLDSTDTDDPADEFEELLPKHKKRKTTIVPLPTKAIRQKKANHMPQHSSKQNRCRNEGCYKKTTVTCKKCAVYLCFTAQRNCFEAFHNP